MASNDIRSLLMMSMGLTVFGFLILYMSLSAQQQNAIDQTREKLLGELKTLSRGIHDRARNQADDLGLKQDLTLEKLAKVLQKTVEAVDTGSKLHQKVEDIKTSHKEAHLELAKRFAEHSNVQEDIQFALTQHRDEHSDHIKAHDKDKAKPATQHWDFSNGAQLSTPWVVNGSAVSMEERHLFTLDKEGYIKFKKGVKRVQIFVGSALAREYAASFGEELKDDEELHIFLFGPEVEDDVTLPKNRFTLIPAGVHRVAGYHTAKSHHYPVVRLESLFQLIPNDVPVELVRMGPHYDFFALLSSGAHLQDIPRLVLRLQDIPNDHEKKIGKAANTTATTSKLQQKGLHRLCCNCVNAADYWLDCFFARKDYANLTKSWDVAWLKTPPLHDLQCQKYVDKETGDAIEAKTGKAEPWSPMICKKR